MELFWICILIVCLYAKTLSFNYNIDDNVPRTGYLNTIPEQLPSVEFFNSKPPKIARVFNVLVHCMNTVLVGTLFGWKVALVFGIHPISVNAAAWVTGNYYAVTAFFALTAMFFISTFNNLLGIAAGTLFFWAAMRSTITAIGFPFLYLSATGIPLLAVVIEYVTSKRFKDGVSKRSPSRDELTWRKLIVAVKVVAYYFYLAVLPFKVGFFHELGYDYDRNPDQKKKTEAIDKWFWISLATTVALLLIGIFINSKAVWIFLALILPFTQYKVLGQFIAERYLYLPMIGVCILLAQVLPENLFYIYCGALIYKTWIYTDTFKNIESLYENSARTFDNSPTGHCCLGSHYLQTDLSKAFPPLNKALQVCPKQFEANLNMCSYYVLGRRPDLAQVFLNNAKLSYKHIQQDNLEPMLVNMQENINDIQSKKSK